jgi:hypothetical protein
MNYIAPSTIAVASLAAAAVLGPSVALAGTLFTLPDASTTLTAIGAYSAPVFSDFLPLIYLLTGILIPVLAVVLIMRLFHH